MKGRENPTQESPLMTPALTLLHEATNELAAATIRILEDSYS